MSQLLSDGINSKGDSETKDNFTVTFTDDSNGVITAEIKFTAKESLDEWTIGCVEGGSGKEENCTIHIASKILKCIKTFFITWSFSRSTIKCPYYHKNICY